MEPGGDEARDVRHIDHVVRAHFASDVVEPLEIDDPRIGARAGHDHLRSGLQRRLAKEVVVDASIGIPHSV